MLLGSAHSPRRVSCLAGLPEQGSRKEQRVSYPRAGLASASTVYTSGAHTVRTMHTVYTRIRASSGLTARHVIYRCAASRPWRINVFSRRLPTYTCKAGLRNRTVRRATGEKSSMVCGALWHGVPSICLQNGLLHPYIAEKNRCAATRGRPFSLQRGVARRENHNFEISLKCPT